MRIAYADPPYPGQAWRHYRMPEVDHGELIGRLLSEFPDGWALSTGSTNLQDILALCPPKVRVLAWVKPLAFFKPGVRLAYAWEPVIVYGGRKRPREAPIAYDWLSCNATRQRGVHGAKPRAFAFWLFEALGLQPGDEIADLYPGSGAITRAWEEWRAAKGAGGF